MIQTRIALVLSALTLIGISAILYLAFLDKVITIEKERLVAVEGVGIGAGAYIMVTREICHRRASDAAVVRVFRNVPESSLDEVVEQSWESGPLSIHFEKGCATKSRRLNVPAELPSGTFEYRSGLRACNGLGRCETAWLTPFVFAVQGQGERRLLKPRMP